jgi:hypothetical protein
VTFFYEKLAATQRISIQPSGFIERSFEGPEIGILGQERAGLHHFG